MWNIQPKSRQRHNDTKEKHAMRHLTIAVAAAALTALFVAPVSAERISGGPIKQNGQCWKSHSVASDMTWGHWTSCPTPAAAPATAASTRRRT
jgi:hypothetical protein